MHRILSFVLVLLFATGAAQAQDKFQRKSGLWELKRSSTVTSGQVRNYQMCVDQTSDNALSPLADGSPGERCDIAKLQREGDKLDIDAACKIPQSTVVAKTHAVVNGKFDSAYKIESKTTFEPPLRGHAESTALLEAKWTGPCKPGQKPGDLIGPRGEKSNINTQKQLASAGGTGEKAQRADKPKKPKRRGSGGGAYAPAPDPAAAARTPAAPPPGTTPPSGTTTK